MAFRKWFHENRHLLNKPDVYVIRLQARWGIVTNPRAINAPNSGPEGIDNYNLEELESNIDDIIKEAGKFYHSNNKNTVILKRFNRYTFLAYKEEIIEDNITGYSDEEVKLLLKDYDNRFKKPLINLLIEYYKLKLNPNIKLEGYLLDQLGFKPCNHCYDDESINQIIKFSD